MLPTTHIRAAAVAALLAVPAGAMASATPADPLLEGARLCTQYFAQAERQQSIPTHLLAAIATTESGRYHPGLGMSVPWPWTINVEGKGYYFNSKAEAMAEAKRLLGKGSRSIDVGCMQVNLKHHPDAFSDLNQAFDPETNVAYAATFLRSNYASLGDWAKATAAYHSRTPRFGQEYLSRIEKSWNQIVGKVSVARGGQAPAAAMATAARVPVPAAKTVAVTHPMRSATTRGGVILTQMASAAPMRPAMRANVIKVSDSVPTRRTAEVMVVTPERKMAVKEAPASVTVAAATPAPVAAVAASPVGGDSVRQVRLDSRASATQDERFVFAN